ncbi:hypothetical protein SHINM1_014050 [Fluviibacter phosphoraccumulans]|nr:hypothetical protein SHINM1_014050 [Fluviibacter phosphoraccumulans]
MSVVSKQARVNRPWLFPALLGFALVTGPKTLQIVAIGYLVHFCFVRLPALLDEAVPVQAGQKSVQGFAKKCLKLAAWVSLVGLGWLAITIAINVIWPTPVAPDFLWPEGK